MKIYNLDESQLEREATKIKNIVIEFLYKNDYIESEVFNDLHLNYGVVVRKPSFFSHLWKKKKVIQNEQYVLIKQVSISESLDKPEDSKPKLSVLKLQKDEDKEDK